MVQWLAAEQVLDIIQDDSEEKLIILVGESIGHFEKKITNVCLFLSVYRKRTVGIYQLKIIVIVIKYYVLLI